ncbi:hypothetical protein [Fluviicola taffensis]|uniref:Outer membrane protein beta-barrel domain-containing protein n=1 Tax=Fluviicola taffensis (strain DSM 16823 / NCIMB 13979 / RW262) TaxID=755732 RepID=F2IH48_FLUTR|nr:hypothetical protein [Fluviicola taffensis]AEA45862.1 hypothetical protein Fluta_3898 [Fluviicola taffensis DSM 16823]
MKSPITLFFVLIIGSTFSQQKDSVKTKTLSYIVKMTHGMTNLNRFDFTNSEWDRLTPGFEIPDSLKADIGNGYYSNDFRSFSSTSYYMFSFSFINGKNKQAGRKFQTTTAIHLGYGPGNNATKYWGHESEQIIDTLTSNQTAASYYVTGNRTQTIVKTYQSSTLAFGIGQHFATNPSRLFQFETGVDLLCLLSINSDVKASYIDDYRIDGIPDSNDSIANAYYPTPVLNDSRSEKFKGTFVPGFILRIPLEMSFKLSKKNEILSRMRIGGELNPGLGMQFTKGKTSNSFSISGGMNFRFAF